ncbi:MAG: ATP-binding cassette domain-containing protein [Fimbriimonadaceae bacterium]|nr:ATP-binding cassette domain-containing protein [Fimbriimonadaceae bacterium]
MNDVVLEVTGIGKRFGAVQALRDVSAQFRSGEIHAVLGENGAGKTTLMNVLAGFVVPDVGTVTYRGKPLPFGEPIAIRRMGLEMVHQHFMLVPAFSVEENVALAHIPGLLRPLRASRLAEPAVRLAKDMGWEIAPSARTNGLPVGAQQRVEILKALTGKGDVLILDEPTAVLGPDEIDDLFRVLRGLRDQGRAIVLIAHKLSEIMAIADRVTVLRRGEFVGTGVPTPVGNGGLDARTLALWMVGELPEARHDRSVAASEEGLALESILVRGDRGEAAVRDLTLAVRRGTVVGIGGVDGNGQVELAEAVVGVRPLVQGEVRWRGERARAGRPQVAYVPQDRRGDGLALRMSVLENLLVAGHRDSALKRGPFLRLGAAARWARGLVERFQIKIGSISDPVGGLSGGNQQKVIVARELSSEPELLVVVNPTRGLDLRATRYVHDQVRRARNAGASVLLISTDLDEIAELSDETYYLSRGEVRPAALGAAALVGGVP